MQKEEDKKVFYGESDIIERSGFDSIDSFEKGIKDLEEELKSYDELLLENQKVLKEIVQNEDFYKAHPEVALPGEISKLHDKYLSLMDRKKILLEKQEKEKAYLSELREAKQEFIREKRKFYKNDVKDRMSLLNEHSRKQQEMKELEYKISIGKANQFEKERFEVLKNEIIPEIENDLKRSKESTNTQEDFNLEELADMMTPEEMNTILQMKASGNYDDTILNNISTRLGVPVSKLEEIAAKKEAKLKEQEKDKEVEKDNNTNENSAGNSGSSSDADTQEKSDDEKTPKVDTQLEKPKKVKGIGKITGKLKAKINANAAIAVAAVAAGIAILAANPLAMGYAVIAGAGKIYMDYSKGKK